MTLTLTPLEGIPLVQSGDDLSAFILEALERAGLELLSGDIFVLAQKIVSKAEGRLVHLVDVVPSERALAVAEETQKDARLVELILQESREVVRTRPGLIVVEHRLGFVSANAGIDHSNVMANGGDAVLLLPKDPDASAQALRQKLEAASGQKLGVLIIDSHGRAWRIGTVGVTIGVANVPSVEDLRGQPDLFGNELMATVVGVADELAAAASLVMGQADEGIPVVHVRGFPYSLEDGALDDLLRPKQGDLFR